jgi:hypothetical protein
MGFGRKIGINHLNGKMVTYIRGVVRRVAGLGCITIEIAFNVEEQCLTGEKRLLIGWKKTCDVRKHRIKFKRQKFSKTGQLQLIM